MGCITSYKESEAQKLFIEIQYGSVFAYVVASCTQQGKTFKIYCPAMLLRIFMHFFLPLQFYKTACNKGCLY